MKSKRKLVFDLIILVIVIIFINSFILGFIDGVFNIEKNKEILNIEKNFEDPYLDKIVLEDITLRKKASSIVRDCEFNNKDCQINKIYRYIVEEHNYYSDPRSSEFIQSPYETMNVKGGDCEDLTILLNSLLENLGIKTYFVLTKDHAYSLACNFDTENLQSEIASSFNKREEFFNEEISLASNYAKYYGGNGEILNSSFEIVYEINSDEPLDIQIVPSSESITLWSRKDPYFYYKDCSEEKVYRTSQSCSIDKYGGVMIINSNNEKARVDVKVDIIYLEIDPEKISTLYYEVEGQNCIVLDSTLGEYGYPGYNTEIKGEKIAIDSLTRKKYQLK